MFGSETKLEHLVIFISPSSDGFCGGTRKLLGVGLSHHELNIEFSVLIVYLLLSLKIAAGVCLIRAQVNNLGSLRMETGLPPTILDLHNSFENGIDITDVSLPCLSIFLSSLQSENPRFNFP